MSKMDSPGAPSRATKSNSKPTTYLILLILLLLALPPITLATTLLPTLPTNTTLPPHHHGPTPFHPPLSKRHLCPDHPSEPWKPDCPPSEQHIPCPDPSCPEHHHCPSPDPPRCPEHSHSCPDDGSYHPPYPGDEPRPNHPEEPHHRGGPIPPSTACASSSEGLYNCLRTTWQRCASGRWSERMRTAEGTVCAPEGLVWSMRTEREREGGGRGRGDGRGGGDDYWPAGPGMRGAGSRGGGVLGMGEGRVGWEVVGGLVGVVVGTVLVAGGLF